MIFTKMHGTGNDFVVIEDLKYELDKREAEIAKKLCHRHFGIGADGILLVKKSDIAHIKMVIINADGSYAEMCGNGIRCFAKYVYENGIVKKDTIKIETGDGIKTAFLTVEDNKVKGITINMGNYSLDPKDYAGDSKDEIIEKKINVNDKEYEITTMLMGVPHTVIMGKLDEYDVKEGKDIEVYPLFKNKTNVNFCEVVKDDLIKVKTWERGAGPTWACGTGSCSCAVCCNYLGYTKDKVKVVVPGGELVVELTDKGVLMTGPAKTVFKGEIDI